MTWSHQFGIIEIALIGGFVLLYILYIGKIHRIARAFHAHARRVWFKFAIRCLYFSLLVIALLGPSFGEVLRKEVKSVGKDIYLAIDLSQSMNAIDIQPSRLEKLKFELKKIVEEFSSDRIGLIVFSSEAFLQCPLTYDHSQINLWVETLKTTLVPSGGTDFGPPLQMALDKFKDETNQKKDAQGNLQTQLVILVSDGEDFGDNTSSVVNDLEEAKIKVFTLGVGTAEGGKIPYRDRVFKKGDDGREVITTLKPDALKSLADQTGAKYYEISNEQNEVTKLIKAVREIKGQLRDTKTTDVAANDYFYFLIAAFALILFDVLLTVRTVRI
ncbi:MAG: VWA domain-containing protein [Bernardetiaceae bacterium]|jgi:Ca-activated chloride channel family protein|nr:VWA domain-containing protein [Bernardetiaceae bacterium]